MISDLDDDAYTDDEPEPHDKPDTCPCGSGLIPYWGPDPATQELDGVDFYLWQCDICYVNSAESI